MAEPERKRRRPAVSCSLCRRRKIRCNRAVPCSNCIRSKNEHCVYENHPSQPPRPHFGHGQSQPASICTVFDSLELHHVQSTPTDRASAITGISEVHSQPSMSLISSSTNPSTPASQTSAQEVDSMRAKLRRLEEQMSKATRWSTHPPWVGTSGSNPETMSSATTNIETTSSCIAGTFHVHHENRFAGSMQAVSRSVMHKNRLFGQSHWINGVALFRELFELIEPYVREPDSKASSVLQKCKSLARSIKAQRAPPWISPPSIDLPQKDVCDRLVDCYLRTMETVFRILHVPSFRREYDALWTPDATPSTTFLIQVKLVFSIGAATYDEHFSLRSSAVKWVYDAHTWLSEPSFKSRLSLQALQNSILLLLAREAAGVGEDLNWISAGALIRTAVYMGLHRDSLYLPKRTPFASEMRRRLWNTILEISLQSSMNSGGPPFLSLDDFDTEPPRNLDDEQLRVGADEEPVPKPEQDYTDMSIAIALQKTFPLRLVIAKSLNDRNAQVTYEDVLRLDVEVRAAYKALRRTLQECKSSSAGKTPSRFGTRVVDLILFRYLSAMHVPFFGRAFSETAYAYSKKVVIEMSLKIWCTAVPSSSISATATQVRTSDDNPQQEDSDAQDIERVTSCGSGFFRTIAMQANLMIAMELRTQLSEEEGSLGPVPLRPDLLAVLGEGEAWQLKCIRGGETNIKGYLFSILVGTQIEGLMHSMEKDELARSMAKAVEDATDVCLPILEEEAGKGQTVPDSSNAMTEMMDDWDFMGMTNAQFNFGNADLMSWDFNDGAM